MGAGEVVLGVSFDYHDAAAAVLVGGELVAAAEEERFTRRKHDPSLPRHAIKWCLDHVGVGPGDLSAVAFYSKPLSTYERVLMTHAALGPKGLRSLTRAVSAWSRSKLWVSYRIERQLRSLGFDMPPLHFAEHHLSHAASAYFPSPYERAVTLTFDGVGEWATSSIGVGSGNRIELLRELRFPDSVGLLYSTITAHCGFAVNDGEYKLMGLAPYGSPTYVDALKERVVDVRSDGSLRLDLRYFDYVSGRRMAHPRLYGLLDGPPRPPGSALGQREADLARSVQVLIEEVVLRSARFAHRLTGERDACLAGGVALNCVANQRLVEDGPFDRVWVQPAGGDDGGAIGAAMWSWHHVSGHRRAVPRDADGMSGCLLGPGYTHDEVAEWLRSIGVPFDEFEDRGDLEKSVAAHLDGGAVVGWFQGRMEFGPRALGNRSILADPRDPRMVARLNSVVKQREGFRPFAPSVLAEEADRWFEIAEDRPYMVMTAPVRGAAPIVPSSVQADPGGPRSFAGRLEEVRSKIPACTHVDGSARVQTVDEIRNPRFHALLRAFFERTGCPVVLNTSFNGADEPIVRTPADALRCFRRTSMDVVVLERCVVRRSDAVLEPEAA